MSAEAPFNAEQTTARWTQALEESKAFTDQDLFEISKDIMRIHNGEEWQVYECILGVQRPQITLDYTNPQPQDLPYETINVSVDQGRHHQEFFELRHGIRGTNTFTTWWLIDPIYSYLAEDQITGDENAQQVYLQPRYALTIAHKLWAAHEDSLRNPQLETA